MKRTKCKEDRRKHKLEDTQIIQEKQKKKAITAKKKEKKKPLKIKNQNLAAARPRSVLKP